MLVDHRVGGPEGRQHERAPDEDPAGPDRDEQGQQMRPDRPHLGGFDQMQGCEQDYRGDPGADRGFRHGDVHRVEHNQYAGHQEAVDGHENDDAEQAALAHDGDRHYREQRQKRHIHEDFYGCLRSVARVGGAAETAAVLGQHRPDVFMHAGLRQGVRHDRTGKKEQGEQETEVSA